MGTTPAGMRGHLTLGRAFVLLGAGVAVLMGVLFAVLLRGWRVSIMDRARTLREEASRRTLWAHPNESRDGRIIFENFLRLALEHGQNRERVGVNAEDRNAER